MCIMCIYASNYVSGVHLIAHTFVLLNIFASRLAILKQFLIGGLLLDNVIGPIEVKIFHFHWVVNSLS